VTVRFALVDDNRKRVHYVEGDEAGTAYCGVAASMSERYSRRSVGAIRKKPTCGNCAAVMAARQKAAVR
jgi:hypothetical protein